jgi:hypothetical protein
MKAIEQSRPLTGIPLFDNWPKGVKCYISNGHGKLEAITYAQLKAERIEKQRKHLAALDEIPVTRQAGYVWTFYQPGLFGFAYQGWWAYIRTAYESWQLGVRGVNEDVTLDVMRMFPCGVLPIKENYRQWMETFGETYSRPGRFKQQGLAMVWVEFVRGYPRKFHTVDSK